MDKKRQVKTLKVEHLDTETIYKSAKWRLRAEEVEV